MSASVIIYSGSAAIDLGDEMLVQLLRVSYREE